MINVIVLSQDYQGRHHIDKDASDSNGSCKGSSNPSLCICKTSKELTVSVVVLHNPGKNLICTSAYLLHEYTRISNVKQE